MCCFLVLWENVPHLSVSSSNLMTSASLVHCSLQITWVLELRVEASKLYLSC